MKRLFIFLFSILFFAQSSFAAVENNIKEYHLDNGQTLIVKELKNNPIVIIDTFIKTGSVNEDDKNNGVAHFLEHLFFKGTTNHKRGEFEKQIERRGGVFNAATSRDYTHYYIKIDSKYFDEALALHSDMLLNIAIPENELNMERKVVLEEITRSADNPDNKVFDNFMKMVFSDSPYGRKILGTKDIISTISKDEIMKFHDTWYTPDNMVTVIVGDVDAKKIIHKITKSFSDSNNMKISNSRNQKAYNIKKQYTKKSIIEKADVDTGYMILGYKTVGTDNLKESYALNIASSIFAEGQNSILYKVLKEDENLIINADAGNYALKNTGVFYVALNFKPQNYNKVISKVKDELEKFRQVPIDEKRLLSVKNAIKRQFEYSNEKISSISNMLGYDVAVGNGITDYTNYLDVIDSITPQFIQETLNKYLKKENLIVSVLLPEKFNISKNSTPDNIFNTAKAPAKFISSSHGVKKYILNNGATLLLNKNTNNNIIATKLFIKGGSLAENIPGTSDILSNTILKGTKNKSGKEIENLLDNIGTDISVSGDYEFFELSMKTTKYDFIDAFIILQEILNEPEFSEKNIVIAKQDALNLLKASKDNPQTIAFDNYYELLYQSSPFLKTNKILEQSIPKISRNDVIKLYKELFSAKNMIISVSGNFDEKTLIENFSQLKNLDSFKKPDEKILKAYLKKIDKNEIKKEAKKSKGAWLIQGWQTNGLSSQDFITLKVISTYLGSGFTSKLFVNLREEKGLAYEVGSNSSSKYNQGNFFMYIGTNPENLSIVQNDFNNEINDLKCKKISEKELDDLKSMFIGRLQISQETNMQKAFMHGYYELFDKGYQFGYDYPELVQKVSANDILEVSRKYFSKPYIMSIVAEDRYIK